METHRNKSTTDAKRQPKQPAKTTPPGVETVPSPGLDSALFEAGDLPTQVARLADVPWQSAQQQGLAAHIGQRQGNRHLQRVFDPAHHAPRPGWPQTDVIARWKDEGPYTPGEMSRAYWSLPAEERAKVNAEVDRRFQAETGVTRQLDPHNPADTALVRLWLRLRDAVMAERLAKPEEPEEPKPEEPKPEEPKTGLSFEEAKKKILEAGEGWGTDEEAIYTAIRDCSERAKLQADAEVQALLKDELSGHELWKAQLLLAFGQEAAFPAAIQEIWSATEGWGTDEARIYQALQKLTEAEVAQISKVPGLWDMLRSELSGKDMKAAEDLLSGDYAKAIARHKTNVAFVKTEIENMRDPAKPLHVRNTAEWLLPKDPTLKPKNDLFVLTPTHDSAERAKQHGKKNEVAYFGDTPQFPDDSADYDAHIEETRNIHYSAPSVAGEHLERKIWMHDPAFQTNISLEQVLVHEVEHDADRHDTEAGYDKPFKSPEESWNRYKTEFRAYWIDGQRDSLSTRSGSATAPFDNEKQKSIFDHMYGSSADDVYAVWLRPNYDKNTKVDGKNFQDLVHAYTKPEGVNLINSPRIDNFFLALQPCKKADTDLTTTPLAELTAAAQALNADDQTYINSAEALRLQEMMKSQLATPVLQHVAKIVNGGSLPGWA